MKNTVTAKPTATKQEQVPYFSQENEHDNSLAAIQPMLTVGEVDDPYEKEAEQVADHVMSFEKNGKGSNALHGKSVPPSATIHRKPIFESENEQEGKPGLNRKADAGNAVSVQPTLSARLNSTKGKGTTLPSDEQSAMGDIFGHSFNDVRIHTDPEAASMSKELHAQAFTHGPDIYFNEGKFDTQSEKGRHLLAHELTHTIQQQGENPLLNRKPDIQKDNEEKKVNIKDMDDAALKALGETKEGSISKKNGKVAFHFKDFPTKQYVGPFVTKDSAGNETLAAPPFQKPNTERKTKQASVWRKEALPKVTAVLNNIIDKQQIKGPEYQLSLVNSTGVGVRGTVEQIAKEISVPFWGLDGKPIGFQIEHKVDWQIAGGNHDVDVISNLILLDAKSNIDVGQAILARMKTYYSKIASYYSKTKNIEGIIENLSEGTGSYDIFCENLVGVSESVPGSLLSISNFELNSAQTPFSDKLIKITDGEIPEGKIILKTSQKGGGFLVAKDLDNSVMSIKFENGELKSITLKNVVKDEKGVLDTEQPNKNLSFQKESKDRYKVKTEGFAGLMKSVFKGIKAMSPIEWSEVDFSPHTGFTASGQIKPTPKLLEGALLTIELSSGEFVIAGTITVDLLKKEGRFPKPFSLDYCTLNFAASSSSMFSVSGDVGFSLKNVGKGNVGAFVKSDAFGMEGKFIFEESKKFKKAEIGFTYTKEKDDGKWEITGDIVFGKALIKVVETGNISISYDGKAITGKGSADLTIPKFKKLELSAAFLDSGNFEFKAKADIKDLPGVKDVNATVIINRKDGAYALDITGTATPVFNKIPGLEIKPLTISYGNGVFKIEGGLGYKKGMIEGNLTLGVTNGAVDAEGKVTGAGKDGSGLSIYGNGTAKVTFLKGMDASISAALDPDGELWIWGKLSVKATPFENVKKNFNIFSFAQTVPLVGVPFAAVILRFGGDANLIFDWQPLTINIETTLAKSRLEDLQKGKLGGGISLSLTSTANAKIELGVTIGIGVEVAIVGVSLNGKGTLGFGISVPLEAKTSGQWNLNKGLTIEEAEANLKAIPEAYAKLTGLILVELNLLVSRVTVYTYELGSIEKKFDLSQYGLGLTVPLKFSDTGKLEGIDMKKISLNPSFEKGKEKDLLNQVADSDSRPVPSREEMARIALRKEIRSKLDAKRNSKASVDMYQYATDLRARLQKGTPEMSNDINQILEQEFTDVERIQLEDFRSEIMMAKDPAPVKLKQVDVFEKNHKTVSKADIDILRDEIKSQAPSTAAPSSAQRKQMDVEGDIEEPKDSETKKSKLERAQETGAVESKQPKEQSILGSDTSKNNDAGRQNISGIPKPQHADKLSGEKEKPEVTGSGKENIVPKPGGIQNDIATEVPADNVLEQPKPGTVKVDKEQPVGIEHAERVEKKESEQNWNNETAKAPENGGAQHMKAETVKGTEMAGNPGEKKDTGKAEQPAGEKKEIGNENPSNKEGEKKEKKGKNGGKEIKDNNESGPTTLGGEIQQPDIVAWINNEFHTMPALASLLQKPAAAEEYPAEEKASSADLSIQRQPDKSAGSKDEQEERRAQTIQSITETGERSLMDINSEVNAQQSGIMQHAASVKAEAMGSVQNSILETRDKFSIVREQVNSAITAGELILGSDLAVKTALVIIDGVQSKSRITELFSSEKKQIDDAVNEGILKSVAMRDQYRLQAGTTIDGQTNSARAKGEQKASGYPDTERGREQKSAVRGVAKETSKEIASRKQEVLDAISEVITPIPDEFIKKGEEAKGGLDSPVNELLVQTDVQVTQVITQLQSIYQQALEQLRTLQATVNTELNNLEEGAISQLKSMIPAIEAQVGISVTTAMQAFETARTAVSSQLNQKITEAQQLLKDTPNPNFEGMAAFGSTMKLFFAGTSSETIALLGEAGLQMREETGKIAEQVGQSSGIFLSGTEKALSQLQQTVSGAVVKLLTQEMILTQTVQSTLTAAFEEVITQIETELGKTIDKLKEGFQKTLTDAEAAISQSVTEALGKNDEALQEMDGKMDEAASEAAWDYDHPILSAIGSVLSFIVGLVAGLLMILALVVVFIVAIKLLIVGLVALGISLVVAEIIGVIVGLSLLAYGVYNAYQARTARGEEGGFGTFISSIGDVTGISSIYHGITDEGLSPFERGFKIGEGIGTIGSFFLGKKIDAAVSKGLPPNIANPGRVVRPVESKPGSGGGKSNITPIEKAYEYRAAKAKAAQGSNGPKASAANDSPYTASDAFKLDPKVDPAVAPQPLPQPIPEPGTNPVVDPYAGSSKVGVGAATGTAGVKQAVKPKPKPKEKEEEEEDQSGIYKFEPNVIYDGRKGNFTYSKTHAGASYQKEGHHAWPKVLGGPQDQPLVNMIYSIHQSEIHYGWSPAGSPFPALYGTVYNYLENQINASPTYGNGKGGMNVLQGRKLTHTGGKNSGNQLLIDAMEAGTATAKRLALFVKNVLSTYYGNFSPFSNPQMPTSFYKKGLDKSYNDITA